MRTDAQLLKNEQISSEMISKDSLLAERSSFSLFMLCCAAGVLAIGFALEVNNGYLARKALLAILIAMGFSWLAIRGPGATIVLPFGRRTIPYLLLVGLLVAYTAGGVVLLRHHPDRIDVKVLEVDAVQSLIQGKDPYRIHFTHQDLEHPSSYYYAPGFAVEGGVEVGFTYPPLSLLWAVPGYFAGDVRYAFLIAVVLSALLIFSLSPDPKGFVAVVLFLFVPATLYVLRLAWTEPVVVLSLAATAVCAKKYPKLMPVALGLFFASKQHCPLFAPAAALLLPRFSWKEYLRLLIKASLVSAITYLPFVVWNARGVWQSLVTFQILGPFRPDGLSFSALLVSLGLRPIPQWVILLAVAAAMWFALKKAPRNAAGFAVSVAFISMIFFVLNKQAFCNYYFFSAAALCVALASAQHESTDSCFALVKLDTNRQSNSDCAGK